MILRSDRKNPKNSAICQKKVMSDSFMYVFFLKHHNDFVFDPDINERIEDVFSKLPELKNQATKLNVSHKK